MARCNVILTVTYVPPTPESLARRKLSWMLLMAMLHKSNPEVFTAEYIQNHNTPEPDQPIISRSQVEAQP
jgi:hypothetical protein